MWVFIITYHLIPSSQKIEPQKTPCILPLLRWFLLCCLFSWLSSLFRYILYNFPWQSGYFQQIQWHYRKQISPTPRLIKRRFFKSIFTISSSTTTITTTIIIMVREMVPLYYKTTKEEYLVVQILFITSRNQWKESNVKVQVVNQLSY